MVIGLKAAVTPLGSPDKPRVTLLLKLFCPVMVIVAVPVLDRVRLSAEVELDSKKEG